MIWSAWLFITYHNYHDNNNNDYHDICRLWESLYDMIILIQKWWYWSKKVQKYVWKLKGTRMWLVKISPTVVKIKRAFDSFENVTAAITYWLMINEMSAGWTAGERANSFENVTAALLTSNWGSAPFQMFSMRANVWLMLNELFVGWTWWKSMRAIWECDRGTTY